MNFLFSFVCNMTELNLYEVNGGLVDKSIFKYDNFDKEKNWRKKTTIRYGIPIGIDKREIEYY